jgi:hypothetical protein
MLTTIRHITAADLRWFAEFSACDDRGFAPATPVDFEKWLRGLWQGGQCSPDCCFIAERGGSVVASIVYWLRGTGGHVEHLRFPEGEPQILDVLLSESMRSMHSRGTTNIWAELPSPPLTEPRLSILKSGFERKGFDGRERQTFVWKPDSPPAKASKRLSFRSMVELGQEAFVNGLAEMSADSLDVQIASERKAKGPQGYAASELADQTITRHEPSWWQIAYDSAGRAAGLIMLGIVGRQPAVLLLAVNPTHRGHHLSRDLLNHAILTLQGVWESDQEGSIKRSVRGDVDAINIPMVDAFQDVGFSCLRRSWNYEQKVIAS